MRNCDCGPLKFDFRNSATFPSLLPVRCFQGPFPHLRMVLKINQKYISNPLFLWTPKTCLKGTVARDFLPPDFFLHESTGSYSQKYAKIAELKLPSCGLEVADFRKILIAELRSCGCGATFLKKLRNCDCGSVSFKLRNCDCGLKKKLRVPTSARTMRLSTFCGLCQDQEQFIYNWIPEDDLDLD